MDSFGEVHTNIEGEKKLQNDKGDMSIITREVGKGSGTLVLLSLLTSLVSAALLVFNVLIAKDPGLFNFGVSLSMTTALFSAMTIRFLRNKVPMRMPIFITDRKFLLLKALLCAVLIIWFITQVVTYLSVSFWATRFGFEYFAENGRFLFFCTLFITAGFAAWATWGRFPNQENSSGRGGDE